LRAFIASFDKGCDRRALLDAPALKLGGHAKHGEHELGKVRRGVDDGLGDRAKACTDLL
jgi:hypothetical protein